MRTITAPGVEIKEIDRSMYSPAMTGSTCYVMGFADKGEVYQPMEFTSRSAWLINYGEPKTEAEKYFYNACTEVFNNNGRLYCARLPYDNLSFEKVVAYKYSVSQIKDLSDFQISAELLSADKSIKKCCEINGSSTPYLIDLPTVDAYKTNEEKVAVNSIVITDKTAATYKNIQEDSRKGKDREVLGIVPVITTAANGLFAQNLINVENQNVKFFENIGDCITLLNGNGGISGNMIPEQNNENVTFEKNKDLITQLNTLYKNYNLEILSCATQISSVKELYNTVNEIALSGNFLNANLQENLSVTISNKNQCLSDLVEQHNNSVSSLSSAFQEKLDNSDDKVLEEKLNLIIQNIGDLSVSMNTTTSDIQTASSQLPTKKIKTTILANLVEPSDQKYDEDFKFESEKELKNFQVKSQILTTIPSKPVNAENQTIGDFAEFVETLYKYYTLYCGYHAADGDDHLPDTVSQQANTFFIPIHFNPELEQFERNDLKKIGVVVFETFADPSNGNKIAFSPVESFVGSLNPNDVDPNTGVTSFIDTIVNSQSQYINLFSNCFSKKTDKKNYENLDIFIAKPCSYTGDLGFFSNQTKKLISINKSIMDGMNKCFEKVSDINERDIDIVPDAGLANIASFLKAIFDKVPGEYDLNICDSEGLPLLKMWKTNENNNALKTWRSIELKFDNFCRNIRKDCMFIADGPRPLVLQGNKKIVRPSKPTNTIDAEILPYIKFITGLNTNYGAGYLDWYEIADEYTGDTMWLPPSIKVMGVYINVDLNYNYWDAPAGLTRGIVRVLDCAFSPSIKQAGSIYDNNWNYSINYPQDGIILEGQKTFQVKPSAFDRVNVRRLFLRLERAAYKVARYFVYEGNTAYTRQKLVDALSPYFREAKVGGGVYDYRIICDETINTPEVIDRNELKVKIGIKPTKTAEFIMIDFIAVSTGGSFEEAMV